MISHSKSFDRARQHSQRHLDFVVLVCSAIPQITRAIAAGDLTQASMAAPDHFKGVKVTRLASLSVNYPEQLARASIVTLFSFFEAYIRDLLVEIVSFHGGDKAFVANADRRTRVFLASPPVAVLAAKRKLQEPAKKALTQKYRKYSNDLKAAGFRFPSELMASTGVRHLIRKASAKGFRAWEIVQILEEVLHFPLSAPDRSDFENVRAMRNDIAHGSTHATTIKDAMLVSAQLHRLAAKIDKHVVEHFFVLELYA